MFQLDDDRSVVIYRRPTGRLMRPSDRMIPVEGLGDLDGFMDVLKNFGSGAVKMMTGGIYDPNKNRFYVPFSSGQVRNWMQGTTNTATLGLVKTDKFFSSKTGRILGHAGAAVQGAAAAYFGGKFLINKFGSTPGTTPTGTQGPALQGGQFYSGGVKAVQGALPTKSLFSLSNVGSKLKTTLDVLSTGSKIVGTVAGAAGGGAPPPQQPQGSMVVMPVALQQPPAPAPAAYYPPQMGQYGGYASTMPGTFASNPMMTSGPGMMMMPGGGGGIGPPGSEFAGMDPAMAQAVMAQQQAETQQGIGTAGKIGIAVGVGGLLYYFIVAK